MIITTDSTQPDERVLSREMTPAGGMPEMLVSLLAAAFDAEQLAKGTRRRIQFRATRSLLAAVSGCGYSVTDIATALGRSTSSIRDRAGIAGTMTMRDFAALAHLSDTQTHDLLVSGAFMPASVDPDGTPTYSCVDLVRVFLGSAARR